MSTKPAVPAGGAGKMQPHKQLAPSTTGRTRPTMGTEAFHLVDDASASDTRRGFLEARPQGVGSDTSIFGVNAKRRGVETNGPSYGISASRGAQAETYPSTLANGRLMPGKQDMSAGFSGGAASSTPSGGGRRGSGSRKPKGSWTPPNKGRTS
jgi:hypothetical protein